VLAERDKVLQKRLAEKIFEEFILEKQMMRTRELVTRREQKEEINRRTTLILESNLKDYFDEKMII
jgi:hypothetical protein